MTSFYDRNGQPMSMEAWAAAFESREHTRLAVEHIGPFTVSTIWLGLDHGWGCGPPLIFETMVFPATEEEWNTPQPGTVAELLTAPDDSEAGRWMARWSEVEMQRYSTEAAALAGHDQVAAKVRDLVAEMEDAIALPEEPGT